MTETDSLTPYRGDAIYGSELFGDSSHYRVEVGMVPTECALVWAEDLEFHVDVRGLSVLVHEGPEMMPTAAAIAATESELKRLLGTDQVWVSWSDSDDSAIEVLVGFTLGEATMNALAEAAWPYVATLTNVFDPGTFGAEYVMGNVARMVGR